MKNTTEIITTKTDYNADGTIDSLYSTTNKYDKKGILRSSVSEFDYDADGIINSHYSSTYDRRGNQLTGLSEGDSNDDGTIDSRSF